MRNYIKTKLKELIKGTYSLTKTILIYVFAPTLKKRPNYYIFCILVYGIFIGVMGNRLWTSGNDFYDYVKIGRAIASEPRDLDNRHEVIPQGGGMVEAEPLQKETLAIPSQGSIEELIAYYFKGDSEDALLIAQCESGLNPKAFNPTNNSNDRGIFQISTKWHPEVSDECGFDEECNIREAKRIFDESGWEAWMCANVLTIK